MSNVDWVLLGLVSIVVLLWYIHKLIGEGVDAIKGLHMEVRKLSHREMPEEWDPDWDDKPSLIERVDHISWQLDRVLSAMGNRD